MCVWSGLPRPHGLWTELVSAVSQELPCVFLGHIPHASLPSITSDLSSWILVAEKFPGVKEL